MVAGHPANNDHLVKVDPTIIQELMEELDIDQSKVVWNQEAFRKTKKTDQISSTLTLQELSHVITNKISLVPELGKM